MSTTKGTLYLQRLEQARCNGNWDEIPELARKVQKHAPGRKCLALTAATEAKIHQLLPPPLPHESPSTIVSYIVSLDALQDTLQQELDRTPEAAIRLPSPAGGGPSSTATADDIVEARVTIAWACMLKGEWEDVVRVIPGVREVSEEFVGVGKAKDGYIEIARIKSLVLQGIALSHTNPKDLSIPLQLYKTAIRQAATLPTALRASPSTTEWTERALSHAALTTYRCWLENNSPDIPSPPATVCHITPRKHEKPRGEWKTDSEQATPSLPPTMEDAESIHAAIGKSQVDEATISGAFKAFHRFVSELPRQKQPTLTSPSQGSDPLKDAERREVYRHYFRFLSVLLLPPTHPDAPYPRIPPNGSENASTLSLVSPAQPAGTPSQVRNELNLVQNIYEAYLLNTHSFPAADTFHQLIGEFVDIVCENWRVAGGSGLDAEVVSECLYRAATKTFHSPRILRHLFYVLTSMGNLADAVLSLETYLDLSENAAERIAKGKIEKDIDSSAMVLTTAADGIRMLTKYLGEGAKALKIAGRCEKWTRDWKVKDPLVLGIVYRGIGTANAAWARQTVMGEERSEILLFAKKAFEKSLKSDPEDMDAYYGIATVHADLGDTTAAIKNLRKALKRIGNTRRERGRKAAVGHALSVLLSAQEEFDEAEKICTKALVLLSPSDPTTLSVDEKTLALELQMTRMALLEATSGPLSAVGGAETLLTLYNRLFPPPLVPPSSQFSPEPPSTAKSSRRPSTASRISRIFTMKPAYEKQYSISANDLSTTPAPLGCIPPTRPGTGRPDSSTSQSVRVRQRSTYRGAPRIRVTATEPIESIPPSLAEIQAAERSRKGRRYSVSGGTIRRSKSVKSTYSVVGTSVEDEIPPLPSSTDISSPATPTSSGGDEKKEGAMFSVLKSKLQRVHSNGTFSPSGSFTPSRNGTSGTFTGNGSGTFTPKTTGTATPVSVYDEKPQKNLPNNLPRSALPNPIAPVPVTETPTPTRNISRPVYLPEPVLQEAAERRRSEDTLRTVWLFMAALYRRCGWVSDARDAVEEAALIDTPASSDAPKEGGFGARIGTWGGWGELQGEGAVNVERALQALENKDLFNAQRYFEAALAADINCPGAIVGLSQLLLGLIPSEEAPVGRKETVPLKSLRELEEEAVMRAAKQSRAVTLLRACTESPRGWGCSEAWYCLAEALEREGDVEGAKRALWRVVAIEDGRGVRDGRVEVL
ncbi:uncharacterized protein H6S33_007677 [Morchella sextelata]|uniref:uncharacterized protein n=1 Tax=Morchella sextelata TaxID=1174677 RepID=UPI001D037843|nr:uncharacterized protein H6S33_007677 [Morchella sextelata]KAH0603355.1 hypothetical protein H6S33_007677 [Morchella sextelata]